MEKDIYELAKETGGDIISLASGNTTTINIFDLNKPEITEEYLQEKAQELRNILEEANKENMAGSTYARERLKDLSPLDNEPEWKKMASQILEEYAKMLKNEESEK